MSAIASPHAATRNSSGRVGTTLKGRELHQCYSGPVDEGAYRHGAGAYVYPNTYFSYEGEYVNGVKQGRGKLTIGGGYFEGVFVDDEIQGEGVRVWENGNRFSGNFEKGEPVGAGFWEGGDGSRYEGEFSGYMREGEGTLWLANGDKYVGTFSAHKFHGRGEYLSVDGTRYTGNWATGLKNGQGELRWTDGSYYKGEFSDDKQHGTGELYSAATSIVYKGDFSRGDPVVVPERLFCCSPPAPDLSAKNPTIPEATIGLPLPFDVTAEVQYKTETLQDKPPEDEKPRSRPGKNKSTEPVPEGPFVVTEWFRAPQESGRVLTLTVHVGDLSTAPTDELLSAAPIPFDPSVPDITQIQATVTDGYVDFSSFVLGRPAPTAEGNGDEAESDPHVAEEADEGEELVEFESGMYTVRVVAEGLQPYAFKLNVTSLKPEKGSKKKDKGGKGKKS